MLRFYHFSDSVIDLIMSCASSSSQSIYGMVSLVSILNKLGAYVKVVDLDSYYFTECPF